MEAFQNKLVVCLLSAQDVDSDSLLLSGMDFAEELFSKFKRRITNVSCGIRLEAREKIQMKSGKFYDYARKQNAITSGIQSSAILNVTLYAMPPEFASAAFDWSFIVEFGAFPQFGVSLFQFGIDVSGGESYFCDCKPEILKLWVKMLDFLSGARYGFASVMPAIYMPIGYATGLMGRAPDELMHDANAWRNGVGNDLKRMRSVHGLNLVSKDVLTRPVGGIALDRWIQSGDGNRGALTQFSTELSCWSFFDSGNCQETINWNNPRVTSTRNELMALQVFPWQEWLKIRQQRP